MVIQCSPSCGFAFYKPPNGRHPLPGLWQGVLQAPGWLLLVLGLSRDGQRQFALERYLIPYVAVVNPLFSFISQAGQYCQKPTPVGLNTRPFFYFFSKQIKLFTNTPAHRDREMDKLALAFLMWHAIY